MMWRPSKTVITSIWVILYQYADDNLGNSIFICEDLLLRPPDGFKDFVACFFALFVFPSYPYIVMFIEMSWFFLGGSLFLTRSLKKTNQPTKQTNYWHGISSEHHMVEANIYLQHSSCDFAKRVGDDEQHGAGGVAARPAPFLGRGHSPVQGHQAVVAQLQVVPHELDRAVAGPARLVHALQDRAGAPRPPDGGRVIAETPAVLQEIVGQRGRFADHSHRAWFHVAFLAFGNAPPGFVFARLLRRLLVLKQSARRAPGAEVFGAWPY